jgi:hypothetical protein
VPLTRSPTRMPCRSDPEARSSPPSKRLATDHVSNRHPTPRRLKRLALVVACADRKRVAPPLELRLRSVTGSLDQRVHTWQHRVATIEAPRVPAVSLYAGDHWQAVLDAFRRCQRYTRRTDLWVVSAGYGLIPATALVKPYSATFAAGAADAVWRAGEDGERATAVRQWWAGLPHEVRLADLLEPSGDAAICVVAGANYVEALDSDLRDALAADGTGEQISVLSAGARRSGASLDVDERFRSLVGGVNSSLNARVLGWLADRAETHGFRRSALERVIGDTSASLPPLDRRQRQRATEDELERLIRQMVADDPGLSRTRGLQHLRGAGIACEQGRFRVAWETYAVPIRQQQRRDAA